MKKNLWLMGFLLFSSATHQLSQAQVTCFKIENGQKTPFKEGDKFEISVDKDLNAQTSPNFLVEIDLAAFQKKHNYDNFRVRLKNEASEYSYSFVNSNNNVVGASEYVKLTDPVFKKKYTGVKTLQFYLFKPQEGSADPKSFFLIGRTKTDPSAEENKYQVVIEGGYVKGEEEYYDNNSNSWKKRDMLSEFERVFTLPGFNFKLSDEYWLNTYYRQLVKPGEHSITDKSKKYVRGVKDVREKVYESATKVERMTSPVGSKLYKQIPEAIVIVVGHQEKLIQAETDQQKAIDLVYKWNTEYPFLVVHNLDNSTLKALNKELKSVTDPNAILELFKKHNASPKAE